MWRGLVRCRNGAFLAACLTVGILALGLCVLKSYDRLYRPDIITVDPRAAPFWGPAGMNAYFMGLLVQYDSTGQRLALRVAVAALAPVVLFAPCLRRLLPLFGRSFWRRATLGLVVCAALVGYAYSLRRSASLPREALWVDIVGLSVGLAFAVAAGYARRGLLNRVIGVSLLVLVAAADLPGFLTKLDLSSLNDFDLIFVEHHFSVVLGQAERLAAGHRLVELVTPRYGFLLHFLLAAFQRDVRPLTMGQTILILQCLQFLYLVLCICVFSRQSRGNYLICVLASLLVIPWYHFSNNALLYPNESAWRTLGFPLALLSIRMAYRWPLTYSSFTLGGLAGCLFLLNVESGIPATVGLLASLLYRTRFFGPDRRLREVIRIAPFLLGISTAWLLFLAAWRLFLGYLPDPSVAREIIARIAFWSSSGFGGVVYPGQVMPLALFAWSIFILIYAALTASDRGCPAHGVRIGAAAISLVWLSYYANRPAFWNLSGFGFLYAIPTIDAARRLVVGVRLRRPANFSTLSALALTAIVTIPSIGEIIQFNFDNSSGFRVIDGLRAIAPRFARAPGTVELSGVILRKEAASEIEAKAHALARFRRVDPVIFLTLHSYLIPKVSGVYPQLPVGDLVGESLSKSDYDRLLNYVKASGASEIYVDPISRAVQEGDSNPYFEFYRKFLRDIQAAYRADRFVDGWEIWMRRDRGMDAVMNGQRSVLQSVGTS